MLCLILIRKYLLHIIFSITFIINLILLAIVEGPIWGLLCFPLWTLIFLTFLLTINKKLIKKKKWKNKLEKYFSLVLVIILIVSIFYLGFYFFMMPMTIIKSELNKSKLQDIADELFLDNYSDYQKTLKVLEWFDEDNHNIFNQYHLWEKGIKGLDIYRTTQFKLFNVEPYIGIRNFFDSASLWILTSKYGHCGEYGLLFRDIADACGLNVRLIRCNGENHVWNEVLINGSWIIVDATCHHPHIRGFNLSRDFMERKVGSDIPNVTIGNVSYVQAEWLNGTSIDVTSRYTNLTNITVSVVDENKKPIANVKVELYSLNRLAKYNTKQYNITDSEGKCNFKIGGGEYTFQAEVGFLPVLYGEYRDIYSEETQQHESKIVLKTNFVKSLSNSLYILIIIFAFLILYLKFVRKKKKI